MAGWQRPHGRENDQTEGSASGTAVRVSLSPSRRHGSRKEIGSEGDRSVAFGAGEFSQTWVLRYPIAACAGDVPILRHDLGVANPLPLLLANRSPEFLKK